MPRDFVADVCIPKDLIGRAKQLQPIISEELVHEKPPNIFSLSGSRILIVEEDMLIAAGVEQGLRSFCCEPVGPAGTVSTAIQLVKSTPDLHAAVVDLNLHGHKSWPVVEALRERGVPFALATGYGDLAEV